MAQWLIVWIVRIIIFENRKCFWIIYSNSNTFHVEFFVRFESMQKIGVNAFLIENGTMVNSLNNYFRKQQMVLRSEERRVGKEC